MNVRIKIVIQEEGTAGNRKVGKTNQPGTLFSGKLMLILVNNRQYLYRFTHLLWSGFVIKHMGPLFFPQTFMWSH